MFSPSAGNVEPRKNPSRVIDMTQRTAPMALQVKKRRRSIIVTPATTVM